MDSTCPDCGSQRIIPDAPISVSGSCGSGPIGGYANIEVQGDPQAWLFKDTVMGRLTLWICCDCGRVEVNVNNLDMLYEKYQKARQAQAAKEEA
jgi:hypothetical protein